MQDHEARLGFTHNLGQGRFVAFKQGHIIGHAATPIGPHQDGGGDTRGQISPRTVVDHPPTGRHQRIGNHAGGGGFAVGTGHTNHPPRQLPRQVRQNMWRHTPRNHPGHGSTATTPQQPTQQSSQPSQPNRHHVTHHTDTLRLSRSVGIIPSVRDSYMTFAHTRRTKAPVHSGTIAVPSDWRVPVKAIPKKNSVNSVASATDAKR